MKWIRLTPGIDAVPCENSLLLKSDFVALRLEGASAVMVLEKVIPFLNDWRTIDDLCSHLADYHPEAVCSLANQLATAGVLTTSDIGPIDTIKESPWHALLHIFGIPVNDAIARMRNFRAAILGLEHVGGAIALQLAQLGVGVIKLADPGLFRPADSISMPPLGFPDPEAKRQHLIAELLKSQPWQTSVSEFAGDVITKEGVTEIVRDVDFVIAAFDRAFSASHQWVNSACLAIGTPALYCDIQGIRGYVGPLVFPGETACFMCWRMRYISACDNFAEAMAYETTMDKIRTPAANHRPVFPPLVSWAASLAVLEVLRATLGLAVPQTANRVLELNALDLTMQEHQFLHRPDCPSCKGKLKASTGDKPDVEG